MKTIFILFLLTSLLFSNERYQIESPLDLYYDISPTHLYTVNLDDDEIIFFGTAGSILRTYDNGQNWKQNFSGTKDFITDMHYDNSMLYGITDKGRVMVSDDKGNYWKFYQVTDTLTGITSIDNQIICSDENNLYVSSNKGLSWTKLETQFNNIKSIFSQNSSILIIDNNSIYKSDDYGNSWSQLETEINEWKIKKDRNKFYIYNKEQISKLNSDYSWTTHRVNTNNQEFKFTKIPNGYLFAITYLENFKPKIYIYKYSFETNATTQLETIQKIGFGDSYTEMNDYVVNDMIYNNGKVYLSNSFKTILQADVNDTKWKVISNFGSPNLRVHFLDSLNWVIAGSRRNAVIYTTDGGATFPLSDTLVHDKRFKDVDYRLVGRFLESIINKNKVLAKFSGSGQVINTEDGPYSSLSLSRELAIYDTENKKSEILDINLYEPYQLCYTKIHAPYKNGFVLGFNYTLKQTQFEPPYKDSIESHNVFYLDENLNIDTLGIIRDRINIIKCFVNNEELIFYGYQDMPSLANEPNNVAIYRHNKEINNFEFITNVPAGSNIILIQNKKGEFFLIGENTFFEIDLENKTYKERENNFGILRFQSLSLDYHPYIEDQYFIHYTQKLVDGNSISVREYLKFDSDMNYEVVDEFVFSHSNFLMHPINNDLEFNLLGKNRGLYLSLFKPIEPDRLEYYTSVEDSEIVECENLIEQEFYDMLGNKIEKSEILNKRILVKYKCIETGSIIYRLEFRE